MLFNKRTKKAIKYIWGGFSILIALSMIIAYSGFARLARTKKTVTIPPEVQAQLDAQKNGHATSAKEQAVLDAIKNGKLKLSTSTKNNATKTPDQINKTPIPRTQKLKLEI